MTTGQKYVFEVGLFAKRRVTVRAPDLETARTMAREKLDARASKNGLETVAWDLRLVYAPAENLKPVSPKLQRRYP